MMHNRKKLFDFKLLPVIIALAGPTIIEQLMQTLVQYIDTAMVGSLGTAATAAVGSTTTVNWLVGTTISAFGVGFLAIISQAIGAGDEIKAKKASAQAMLVTIVVGLFFTAIVLSLSRFVPGWMQVDPSLRKLASTYFFILYLPLLFRTITIILGTVLRAAGDTKTPMLVGIYVNIVNVVLNFLLIYDTRSVAIFGKNITLYGAGLGVVGAGVASAASVALGGVLIFVKVFKHPLLSPKGESLKPNKEILLPAWKITLPNMLQRFCTSLGYVVFASMINSLGEISTAAHTVANTVESAFYIPGYGMMTAAATLTGNAIGAGDKKLQRDTSRLIIAIEVTLMVISGGLLFVLAPSMTSIFTKSDEVIRLGSTVLRMVALSEPFYGVAIVIEGMMQGAGMTKNPFRYNVFCMWAIRILGTFICINLLGMGLVSAWACMIGNNILLFLLFVIGYRNLFK